MGAHLAACDMTAEGCGAAVLDGRHHLEMAEADMAGVGSTPCRAVGAEDIRDLERRTRHGSLAGRACSWRQILQRALDLADGPGGDLGIARRGLELLVSEQRLDEADVHAAVEQVGGEAVT